MTMNGRYLGTLANRMVRTGIVLGIVGSDAFQMRRAPDAAAQVAAQP